MITVIKKKPNNQLESSYEIYIPYLEDLLETGLRMLMYFENKQMKEDKYFDDQLTSDRKKAMNKDSPAEQDRKRRMGID